MTYSWATHKSYNLTFKHNIDLSKLCCMQNNTTADRICQKHKIDDWFTMQQFVRILERH